MERALVGRQVDSLPRLSPDARIRLLALPSIGHVHVDRGIRRILVEVPSAGPLRADDVFWAFSGLTVHNLEGALLVVTRADDEGMLDHYGLDERRGHRIWRTVTPAALPLAAARRRIEPTRKRAEAKGAAERAREERRAASSVAVALRHVGVRAHVERVRVQREPFEERGARAETFAPGTRFGKERLWHVEIGFREPVCGPLTIGDGRFLGLGLMAPVRNRDRVPGIFAFQVVSGLLEGASHTLVTTALRRATMARFQEILGHRVDLPAFVSGHGEDGRPASGDTPHLSYVFDPGPNRLLVVAPHIRDHRRATNDERRHLQTLDQAMAGFEYLAAGAAGRLALVAAEVAPGDPLLAPSRCWVSRTPYVVNRHRKRGDAREAIEVDIGASCRKIDLPTPRVVVLETRGEPGVGLTGSVELHFEVAVRGPLLLGRTRHKGGGLFTTDLR